MKTYSKQLSELLESGYPDTDETRLLALKMAHELYIAHQNTLRSTFLDDIKTKFTLSEKQLNIVSDVWIQHGDSFAYVVAEALSGASFL